MRWVGMIDLDDERIESIKYIGAVSGLSILQLSEAIEQLSNSLCESMKILEEIFKDFRDVEEMVESPDDDVVALKKQIKYCKNPMEIKALNKRLNDAYKKKNKKR